MVIYVVVVEPILQYQNFDLESVVAPVNVKNLSQLLRESHYDQQKTDMLIMDFRMVFPWDSRES